jgi:OmpA-OmpF porin, OOP family
LIIIPQGRPGWPAQFYFLIIYWSYTTMHFFTRSLVILISLTSLTLASGAQADGDGLLLEAGAYYTQLDDKFSDNDTEAFFDDKSGGFNLGAGWRFNKWLSVDAGYWDLGSFKSDRLENGDKLSFDTTAYTLGGMVSVPLLIFDVYARGGVAVWDLDARRLEEDGTDPYYGVGLALNFLGSIDFYAEVVRFDLETNIDTVGMGVRLTF